ncbi:MAG: hypothetical protein ACP6IP_00485 [Candidatus Njordarchaeia archaeon]
MLLELWSTKAKDEIRGIDFGDVDNDGKNEVIFASWDGKIYILKSENGSHLWTFSTKKIDGPAEHVKILEDKVGRSQLIGTIHKHILGIDVVNKELSWYTTLDSWITNLKKADIDDDGEFELIALTLKGSLFGVDSNGDKIWSIEGNNLVTPYTFCIGDVDLDGSAEIIKVGQKSNILEIIGSDGGIIKREKLPGEIKSLTLAEMSVEGEPTIIVGLDSGFILMKDGQKKYKKMRKKQLPYILKTFDANGDGLEELVVGDWLNNTLTIYGTAEDGGLNKIRSINVGGNTLVVDKIDLAGGGSHSIIAGVRMNIGVEDLFFIIPIKGKYETLTWFGAHNGVAAGDILNENGNELILRTGREELALYIEVPRIMAPDFVEEKETFTAGFWAPANHNLEASGAIKLVEKTESTRRKFEDVGYISRVRYKAKALRSGSGRLKLTKKNKTKISKTIYLISKEPKIDGKTPIKMYLEDLIPISLNKKPYDIVPKSKIVSTKLEKIGGEIFLNIALRREGWVKIPLNLILKNGNKKQKVVEALTLQSLALNPLQIKVKSDPILLSNDKIQISILNRSRKELMAKIAVGQPLEAPLLSKTLKPGKTTRFTLKVNFEPENHKEKVKTTVYVTYRGLQEHKNNFPLELQFVNDKKIREIIKEIKTSIKKEEKLVKLLADKLEVDEETAKLLLNKLA